MVIELRSRWTGGHVEERVFMGPDKDHLALTGTLMLNVSEWTWLGSTLMFGEHVANLDGEEHVEVLLEGDDEVIAAMGQTALDRLAVAREERRRLAQASEESTT